MDNFEQAVFISYAWGGESEEIVNEIDQSLQSRGIKIIRDKRDLGYRGSIKNFMERIGQGNSVIVVVSDKYLRSPNCMFELVEIAENKQFHDRIFPVVLQDANIYDAVKRIDYVKYWEIKRAELVDAIRSVDPANLQGIRDEIDNYDKFRDKIAGLIDILKDMNTLTPEMHKNSDFSFLYEAIQARLRHNDLDTDTMFDNWLSNFRDEFVEVPAGKYHIGANDLDGALPVQIAEIGEPFYLGQHVITQEQWKRIMGTEPWKGQRNVVIGDRYPATYVDWDDATQFARILTDKDRQSLYRLPSEIEWEVAAAGGRTIEDGDQQKFGFGDKTGLLKLYGWFDENASKMGEDYAHSVGQKEPNKLGLYDMHGNIWEWTNNGENNGMRVLRGGGFNFSAEGSRSAFRALYNRATKGAVIGFRLVRETL